MSGTFKRGLGGQNAKKKGHCWDLFPCCLDLGHSFLTASFCGLCVEGWNGWCRSKQVTEEAGTGVKFNLDFVECEMSVTVVKMNGGRDQRYSCEGRLFPAFRMRSRRESL